MVILKKFKNTGGRDCNLPFIYAIIFKREMKKEIKHSAKISNHTPLKDNQKDKLVYEAVKKQFGLTFIVCFCLRNKRGRFFDQYRTRIKSISKWFGRCKRIFQYTSKKGEFVFLLVLVALANLH